MTSSSVTSNISPNTAVSNSTNVPTKTTVPTRTTVPRQVTTLETSDENDDEFLRITMIIVVGIVVLIILIIIIVFVMRSRHRRRKNVRKYKERLQREPTISVEIIDRGISPRETVHGVDNVLYEQDDRIPVTVFDNHSNHVQTFIHSTETSPTQGNQQDPSSSGRLSQNTPSQGDTSPDQTDDAANESTPVYENTNVSKEKVTHVSERMGQRKAQTTTHELDQPEKDLPEKKVVEISSDYETAFPMSADHSKQAYENITANNTAQADIITPALLEKTVEKDSKNQLHSKNGKDNVDIGNTVNNNNFVSKGGNPKPKAEKGLRKSTDKSNRQENDNDGIHDYENSLTKVTKNTLQQAKLLKSVPPPCNANPYVNVPDIDILEDALGKPVQRQSSEYEDPENMLSLHKNENFKSKFLEERLKSAQIKPPNPSSNDSQPDKSISKKMKSESNARDVNQSGIKYKQNEPRDKSTVESKRVYANINEKNETDLKPPDCEKNDYENEDTVKKLKSPRKMLGKRGFSTSSLETRKQECYLKTSMKNQKGRTGSDVSKESDDVYLPMGVLENEDEIYLKMDDLNDDVYMPMVTPRESEYMRMESNSILPNRLERNGRQLPTVRHCNLPRGYLTSPKPCAGTQSGYVNFSDQPVKYVNLPRSRSTDDVCTNCTYDNAKMRSSNL